jgi:hypothetical protein
MPSPREEFERRLLALVRYKIEQLDEDYPNGYEVGEFLITFDYFSAPEADTELYPWEDGRFAGWHPNGMTFGSSRSWFIDERLLNDALAFVKRKKAEAQVEDDEDAIDE